MDDKILTIDEVVKIANPLDNGDIVTPVTIYRWIKTKGFPKPRKLFRRNNYWSLNQIMAWKKRYLADWK